MEGSQPARSGSSLCEEASSTKPETASSIYSASSRLDGVVDSIPLRNQIHAPNLFHDSIRERKEMGFPGIDAFRENQVALGQPSTNLVIKLPRPDVNHREKKEFKTGVAL